VKEFVLATANPDKAREIREILGTQVALRPRPAELPDVDETGDTLIDNARLKARAIVDATGEPAIADDTGLEVDALGGAPGVYSARYAGPDAHDDDNNRLLLENLRGVENRTARFVCAIALCHAGRLVKTFRGAVEGRIIDEARGPEGFGYDPLFLHEPFGCTFGEASAEMKMKVSHRAQALRAMFEFLRQASAANTR
jgi:XTP/dITP diphosphohydrolase